MSPQTGFVLINEIVPRLRSAIPNAVCFVGCEDAEELLQDGTAMAAKMLHSVAAAGKQVTPGNIAYYTIQLLKSGRRSTGSSIIDVMQTGTQLNGCSRLASLDELVSMEGDSSETLSLHDMLSDDREDPAMIAMRNLDWESFCETQPGRSRAILRYTAEGAPLTELVKEHRVSRSTLQNNKDTLAREIKMFMGEDILVRVQEMPGWKDNLVANREKTACRGERRSV